MTEKQLELKAEYQQSKDNASGKYTLEERPDCCLCNNKASRSNKKTASTVIWRSLPIIYRVHNDLEKGHICGSCHTRLMPLNRKYAEEQGFKSAKEYTSFLKNEGKTEDELNNKEKYKRRNLSILSAFFYGEDIEIEDMYDIVTKETISRKHSKFPDDKSKVTFVPNLHHILVQNNSSVHKGKNEPSVLLGLAVLKFNQVLELTKCTMVTDNTHKDIHDWSYTDIRYYNIEQLPFGLQSEENWIESTNLINEIMSENWKFPSYQEQIISMFSKKTDKDIVEVNNIIMDYFLN